MSPDEQDQRQGRKGRLRRIARALARPRTYLLLLVPVLVAALVMALLPKGFSLADTAPSDDGVSWSPGQGEQDNNNGVCDVTFSGTTATTDLSTIVNALNDEQGQIVNQDGTENYYIESLYPPSGSTSTTVTAAADVDCSIVQTALHTGPGSASGATTAQLLALTRPDGIPYAPDPGARARALTPASDPNIYLTAWYTGALADLAATAAYIGIGVIGIGATVAFGAEAGAGAAATLTAQVIATVIGCIAGAASTAILLSIAGSTSGPLATVTNAVTGCITGAALANIPIAAMGAWLGNQITALLGVTIPEVVGAWLAGTAATAGVELTPVATAVADVAAGAIAA